MKTYFRLTAKFSLFTLFLIAVAQLSRAQVADTTKAPYTLSAPANWTVEHFTLPPDFAPQLNWKGEEELRLHPGWADPKNEGHLSYVFLWWIRQAIPVNKTVLKDDLRIYFSGLVKKIGTMHHIPANKLVAAETNVTSGKTLKGDIATYRATVHMLDFFSQKPIVLNLIIHVKIRLASVTAIRVDASPQDAGHPIWKALDAIKIDFK
ncbi:MAG: hypothetical protein JWP78_604 [Mucilaginibacter sp.]|nr:hypothetical protein [Mucilaginibacter sp.]